MKRRQNSMVNSSSGESSTSTGPFVRASSFAVGEQIDDGSVVLPPLGPVGGGAAENAADSTDKAPDDRYNYALLIILYTLQGIPMGLSASIPFLIQQKVKMMTTAAAASAVGGATSGAAGAAVGSAAAHAAKLSYNANAIFALCSWPFSLKLLWAPIVDSIFFKRFGRRKSWLVRTVQKINGITDNCSMTCYCPSHTPRLILQVPVQALAGLVMVFGSNFVEQELGLGSLTASSGGGAGTETSRDLRVSSQKRKLAQAASDAMSSSESGAMNVRGVTAFFFLLYFLMATQDIAVDGWALTMLSKKNRGRGPVCNSIGVRLCGCTNFLCSKLVTHILTKKSFLRQTAAAKHWLLLILCWLSGPE